MPDHLEGIRHIEKAAKPVGNFVPVERFFLVRLYYHLVNFLDPEKLPNDMGRVIDEASSRNRISDELLHDISIHSGVNQRLIVNEFDYRVQLRRRGLES